MTIDEGDLRFTKGIYDTRNKLNQNTINNLKKKWKKQLTNGIWKTGSLIFLY